MHGIRHTSFRAISTSDTMLILHNISNTHNQLKGRIIETNLLCIESRRWDALDVDCSREAGTSIIEPLEPSMVSVALDIETKFLHAITPLNYSSGFDCSWMRGMGGGELEAACRREDCHARLKQYVYFIYSLSIEKTKTKTLVWSVQKFKFNIWLEVQREGKKKCEARRRMS